MKQRGRKSAIKDLPLNVIEGDFSGARPKPPADLTKRQVELWQEIVNDEPSDFFSTAALRQMLKGFVQSCETLEKLNAVINQVPDEVLRTFKGARLLSEYCELRARELRNCASLGTKLRMTNQARYTPRAAASASGNTMKGSKPWEWDPP